MAETRRIIIDTDPGQDDAIAILLAMGSPELEIAGLTTVAGNVPLALTTANALKLCELAGRTDIPVVQGSIRPLVRPLVTAEAVHGKTGMDGSGLPDPTSKPVPGHAVDWIVDTIMAAPEGTYTLCPLGPLTNIAAALVREPKIAPRIREIVFMGGGFFEGGNTTPAAEFNIYVDPHAAHVVLTSGIKLTMVPLDVTHKALISRALARQGGGAGHAGGEERARHAELLRALRHGPLRHRRRAAARSLRHRLSAAAGAVRRPRLPCRGRDWPASTRWA